MGDGTPGRWRLGALLAVTSHARRWPARCVWGLERAGAQDWPAEVVDAATSEFFGELPDSTRHLRSRPLCSQVDRVNLFVAVHRTAAQRYSDTYLTNGQKRRRSIAVSMRLRRQDDANFTNRTRFLARRVEEMGRPVSAPQLGVATTGEEFLAALVEASRRGPIANLVIYGHAAPTALFMREDRGFYASLMEVAKASHVVSGEDIEKDEQLRAAGARDLSDFERLVARGEIRFTGHAVIVFAGCGVAGKRDIETEQHRGAHGRDHRRESDRLDRRDRPVDGTLAQTSAITNIRAEAGCASPASSRPSGSTRA